MRFAVALVASVIAGNIAFNATQSLVACGLASFTVSFLLSLILIDTEKQ